MRRWRLRDPQLAVEDERFPYEAFRRGQRELAEEVKSTVETGGVLAVRAPTGFGKTAAIIYGLLLAGAERVLYLVRTVNELYPVMRELRRFREPFTVLFSARRTCPLFSGPEGPPPPEDFWDNCRLARLKGVCDYYRQVDNIDEESVKSMLLESGDPPVPTARRIVERFNACPFFSLRKLANSVGFIVATYPYLFRADIFESVLDPYTYSDFVVVVDEAHTLATIHSLLEQELRLSFIEKSIEEVRKYAPEATVAVETLGKLRRVLEELLPRRLDRPTRLDKEAVLSAVSIDLEMLGDIVETIRDRKFEESLLQGPLTGRVRTWTARILQWLAVLSLPESRLFAEPGDEEPEFVTLPMDPAVVVRKPLSEAKAVILASGTLPRGDFVRELLGVERPTKYLDTELAYGRFVKPSNLYVVVARDVTTRYRDRGPFMYQRLAAYASIIARGVPGAKLFVYPSYEVLREVTSRLPVSLDILVESRGMSIDEAEEKVRGNPEISVHAVASGKLVEGVEFTDSEGRNLLHTVVMVGVPYPQPDDYQRTMEEDLASRIGRARARYYAFEFKTLVRVKQALGRATRAPEDRAAYFLLDYRYLRKDLREQLGLPVSRVVSSLSGMAGAVEEVARHLAVYSSSSR